MLTGRLAFPAHPLHQGQVKLSGSFVLKWAVDCATATEHQGTV